METVMPLDPANGDFPLIGRVGAVLVGAAIISPILTVPAVLAFGAILVSAGLVRAEARPAERQPKTAPARPDRSRSQAVLSASEDSFPASDPPSWTPVTGTGTRH